mgnify:CR=1 FL=1
MTMKEVNEIYITLGFEHLFESIYGKRVLTAGWTSYSSFKKAVSKILTTLKRTIEKNVHGDVLHRKRILDRFESFESYSKNIKNKDEFVQQVFVLMAQVQFEIIGYMPENWEPGKTSRVHWSKTCELPDYRTLYYIRTPKQKVQEIIDYAHKNSNPSENERDLFSRIISIRRKRPRDHEEVLNLIKSNEPDIYFKFNES